ncbi:MAG: A/G-specific adenine glycosylase [Chthoniobacteraceae bacterium]
MRFAEESARAALNTPDFLFENPKLLRRKLAAWYQANGRDLPWRRTTDPYAILVSEFMLQQTQVATVIPYFERWLARFPTFTALARADEADVLHAWQGLGYYARARNLHRAAKAVAEQHGGMLPPDPAAISQLPGVGRYTAGALASFAFDLPVAAVDANIARVLARLIDLQEPIDSTSGAARIWAAAEALLPKRGGGRLHTSSLMELGALVCIPRAPRCAECPVQAQCRAEQPELLPLKKARKKTVALEENCRWVVQDNQLLVELQTGSRWKGLWKLPAMPIVSSELRPLVELDYPFTHHRVTLRVFPGDAAQEIPPHHRWIDLARLQDATLAAPHRRAIEMLASSGG